MSLDYLIVPVHGDCSLFVVLGAWFVDCRLLVGEWGEKLKLRKLRTESYEAGGFVLGR